MVKNEQLMQIWVYTDMRSTKKAILEQKNPKSLLSRSIHFWNPIANVTFIVQ